MIELLVVVAIIAILASLLIPALAKSKELATAARCQGNQKQLVTAWLMYADDHDQVLLGDFGGGRFLAFATRGDWVAEQRSECGACH